MSAGPVTQAEALVAVIKAEGYKNILAIGDTLAIHQETLVKLAGDQRDRRLRHHGAA